MHVVPKSFDVYLYDPEHGWMLRSAGERLTLEQAIPYAKDFRDDWAGSRVALVPNGIAPDPFLEFALAIA